MPSLGILFLSVLFCAPVALAAPLTYATQVNISISSPAETLTIASGSLADQLVVNATSVVITMSSSTGGSFILTANTSDLSISASAGGGTDSTSCTNGVASTTISQSSGSAAYTIIPTGTQCVRSNNDTSSSPALPSVGVASAYGIPNYWIAPSSTNPTSSGAASTIIPAPTQSSTSVLSLQATLALLEAKLQSLLAEAANQGITISGISTSGSSSFSRNLSLWDRGLDVQSLQRFLIQQNVGPAARKLASHGATQVFGYLTLNALKEYQASIGIPATGYFGPVTRAYVDANESIR
ncbi:MAG TPA: peptidoglycan-binding domain-containing protein [Bryobacteraceae bacterium]|nr:peptidoglycan-binding domain-containing protein [Bryobacteraceae bacterium]